MKTIGKILTGLAVLVLVVVTGLAIFVRFYLTEERLKALIIPPAEKALGRTVQMGQIKAGLFTGIEVKNLAIKEADDKADFVRCKGFVLSYDLWPLLKRQLVINKIRLVSPYVKIVRNKKGRFNFETLAVLSKERKQTNPAPEPEDSALTAKALPLAFTAQQITVEKALIEIRDETGEIPDTDVRAMLEVSLATGKDLSSLSYGGEYSFSTDVLYGRLSTRMSGKGDFDQNRLGYGIDVLLEEQKVHLSGAVSDYLKEVPLVRLDVSSDRLDLDRLLASLEGTTSGKQRNGQKAGKKAAGPSGPKPPAPPPNVQAQGMINVNTLFYHGVEVKDLLVDYLFEKGVLSVKKMSARTAGGEVTSRARVDLTEPRLGYEGDLTIKGLQMGELIGTFAGKKANVVSGILDLNLDFSGKGTSFDIMKKYLSAKGSYAISDFKVEEVPITRAIANVVGLKELSRLSFKKADGNLDIDKGLLHLRCLVDGKDLRASTKGIISLDGNLNLPVTMYLSKELSDKLKARTSATKYLLNEAGNAVLHLKLSGPIKDPKVFLDTRKVKERLKQKLEKKAIEELGKALGGDKDKDRATGAAEELIKGFFGN